MFTKYSIYAAILIIALVFADVANKSQRANASFDTNAYSQIQNLRQETIIPQFEDWKAKIDAILSSGDLEKLNELRRQYGLTLGAGRNIQGDQRRQRLQDGTGRGRGGREKGLGRGQGRGQGRGLGQRQIDAQAVPNDILTETETIAQKYENPLSELGSEMQNKKEEWTDEIENILNRTNRPGKRNYLQILNLNEDGLPLRFMLWKGGEVPKGDIIEEFEEPSGGEFQEID